MYIYIYMDVAAGRRVRVPSPKIVSNIDGARVSYSPKLCPLIMGRGSRIPPTFGFVTPCGSSIPVSVHGFRPYRLMGRGSRIPPLRPFYVRLVMGRGFHIPQMLHSYTVRVSYSGDGAWVLSLPMFGARVSYPPSHAILHCVGHVFRCKLRRCALGFCAIIITFTHSFMVIICPCIV